MPEEADVTIPLALSNPTLGIATNGTFLDVEEAQANENRAAKIEGRAPRIADREERYPGFVPEVATSLYDNVSFREGIPIPPRMTTSRPEASSGVLPPSTPRVAPTARMEVEPLQAPTKQPVRPTGPTVESPREIGDLL